MMDPDITGPDPSPIPALALGHGHPREDRPAVNGDVAAIYRRLAPIYDLIYGALLQPGRRRALTRLAPQPGESILEVGVGTGLSAMAYPRDCRVVGIDISAPMLARAHARLGRRGLRGVRLCRMDATRLAFAGGCFDAVYAPYVMNVLPDAARAAREMVRVCRPGGRLVFLNHFRDRNDTARLERVLGRFATVAGGVNWHLELDPLLDAAGLVASSVEAVNLSRISSVVVCRRP